MARKTSKNLTEVEQAIMDIIWDTPDCTVEHIREALEKAGRPLALPSIRTMASILEKKAYISRVQEGRKYIFQPLVTRETSQRSTLEEMLDRSFGGSPSQLAATLLSSEMVSEDDLAEVKRLLREKERELKK